jgi:hypothetical protein
MTDICKAAFKVLADAGSPMHYRQVLAKLKEEGWPVDLANPDHKPAIDLLYNEIYGDIRKNGEHAHFRRTGRAMFCAAQVFDPKTMTVATPNATKRNPDREVEVLPPVPRTCGNCRHIEYRGIKEVTLDSGVCARYNDTGRVGVQSIEQGCEHWSRRSDYQRKADRDRRADLLVEVMVINVKAQRGRRI